MLLVPASMPAEAQSVPYYGAIVQLDKVVYSWTDVFQIVVVAPNFNSDPGKIDYIGNTVDSRITITSTNGSKLDFYKLEEAAADNGVFTGAIVLSGSSHVEIEAKYHGAFGITSGEGPWGGTLKAKDGDTITVKFSETYSGSTNTHEAKALVAWQFATLEWQFSQIDPGEGVVVIVVDHDMNLSSFDRDSLSVDVNSDSDSTAVPLVLTEKEIFLPDGTTHLLQNSGIFEGQIIFTDCSPIDQQNNICTPHPSAKVLAKPGDTITVEYIDYTLPGPDYTSSDSLLFAATTKMSGIKTPTPTPTPSVLTSDSSFKKYTDDDNRFTIEYPDDWVLADSNPDSIIAFDDQYDWKTDFQVFWNEDDTLNNRSDSKVLRAMEEVQWEICGDQTFAVGDRKCTDFEAITEDSDVFYTNDNRKVYFVKVAYTLEWKNYLDGQENSMIKTLGLIYDGKGSWALASESFEQVFDDHSDKIIHMMKSFSLDPNAQQQAQPTAKSVTAIPGWIKNNAGWWADGQIPDSAFLQGIQFLIKEGIMVIPPTETSGSSGSQEVPAWIKNNAEWWAEGQIDDNAFVSGIQYLVKVGIIKVS